MFKQIFICMLGLILTCSNTIAGPEMKADEIESWATGLLAPSIEEKRLSGAVVTYVKDGKIQFSRGYGYADYLKKTPVDPETTGFRIGSNTKTFTATAIAQLMDKGIIKSLDDPANKYLKRIQLPSPDNIDITLRHLITHSAGFENKAFHLGSDREYKLPLSADILEKFAPEIINPPGQFSSYNNYGTAILGLIVEDVTGEVIADYFKKNIFNPLGMNHTILNVSPDPTANLSVPYGFLPNGDPMAIPHRSVHPFSAPIGGANSSANDMARYMLAHLDEGRKAVNPLKSNKLMSNEMFAMMHQQIRSNHTLSAGLAMIFFTMDYNGHKMYMHGGNWPGSQSFMVMFPETNSGLFFALLSGSAEVPVMEEMMGSERLQSKPGVIINEALSNFGVFFNFLQHFFDDYRPPEFQDVLLTNAEDYVGSYLPQSKAFSTMERMLSMLDAEAINVELAQEKNALFINGKGPYNEVSSGVFWYDGYKMPISGSFLDSPVFNFVRNSAGEVEFVTPQIGFDAWVKAGSLDNPQLYMLVWLILLLVCLTGLLVIFYPKIAVNKFAKWLPVIIALLLIIMPFTLVLGFTEGDSVISQLFFGKKVRPAIFTIMANLVALLSFMTAWTSTKAWREKYWGTGKLGIVLRLHYTLLALAALAYIPIFFFFNLLIVGS